MADQLKMAASWALEFNDEGLHVVLAAFALLYIGLSKSERHHRKLFLGYCAIFTAVYFCPLFSKFMTAFIGELVYWRMLWMLPLPIILAYVMVRLWSRVKRKTGRALLLAVFAAALAVTGQVIYLEDSPYEQRSNWEKLPSSPVAICDIVNANREEGETALLAAPEDMVPWIRVYDASINQVYGRKGPVWPKGKKIKKLIDDETIDFSVFTKRLRKIGCNFVVLPDGEGRTEAMEAYGFRVIGQVGSYIVYKDTETVSEDAA